MDYLHALFIAIVEGITEFLPVSSTGHMIITSAILGISEKEFTKIYMVNIQFGAILSVVVLYWDRFFKSLDFYFKLFIAFIPAAIAGFFLGDMIDQMLESVRVVALSLLLGGIILVYIDKWFLNPVEDNRPIGFMQAFKIGAFQCLALIPGVSRSAATIIGGLSQGINRKQAAEFSFFLAVPTMFAASAYKLLKDYKHIESGDISILIFGNLVAFVVAMFAIKSFISILSKYGFRWFGYYRIVLGLVLLILLSLGIELHV